MSDIPKDSGKELYCPLSMTRFDSTCSITIWKCQLCEKHILSKDSVRQHLSNCPRRIIIDSITIPDSDSIDCMTKPDSDSSYLPTYKCASCGLTFNRRSKLISHEKSSKNCKK